MGIPKIKINHNAIDSLGQHSVVRGEVEQVNRDLACCSKYPPWASGTSRLVVLLLLVQRLEQRRLARLLEQRHTPLALEPLRADARDGFLFHPEQREAQ